MAISPILMNGMIQRTDDVGVVKSQQDTRPIVEQQNLQVQVDKKVDEQRHQVVTSEDSGKADTHADAREESKNAYFFRKKAKVLKTEETPKDRVVKKSTGGFDMKI